MVIHRRRETHDHINLLRCESQYRIAHGGAICGTNSTQAFIHVATLRLMQNLIAPKMQYTGVAKRATACIAALPTAPWTAHMAARAAQTAVLEKRGMHTSACMRVTEPPALMPQPPLCMHNRDDARSAASSNRNHKFDVNLLTEMMLTGLQ